MKLTSSLRLRSRATTLITCRLYPVNPPRSVSLRISHLPFPYPRKEEDEKGKERNKGKKSDPHPFILLPSSLHPCSLIPSFLHLTFLIPALHHFILFPSYPHHFILFPSYLPSSLNLLPPICPLILPLILLPSSLPIHLFIVLLSSLPPSIHYCFLTPTHIPIHWAWCISLECHVVGAVWRRIFSSTPFLSFYSFLLNFQYINFHSTL